MQACIPRQAVLVPPSQEVVDDSSSGVHGSYLLVTPPQGSEWSQHSWWLLWSVRVTCWWVLLRVLRWVSLNSGQHSWWLLLWSLRVACWWIILSSGVWGEPASVAVSEVGFLNPCNMQNLQAKYKKSVDSVLSRPPHPPKVETCYKLVLSGPPHPPKVSTVNNHFFQDHHTLPKWKFVKNWFFLDHHTHPVQVLFSRQETVGDSTCISLRCPFPGKQC